MAVRILPQLHGQRATIGTRIVVNAPSPRDVKLFLNFSLLSLLVLTFVTGWVASFLGLTELGIHKYGSIAFLVAAGAHVALHWRVLVAQARRIRRSRA